MILVGEYRQHTEERAKLSIPPLPLTAEQASSLVGLLQKEVIEEKEYLLELFNDHISRAHKRSSGILSYL